MFNKQQLLPLFLLFLFLFSRQQRHQHLSRIIPPSTPPPDADLRARRAASKYKKTERQKNIYYSYPLKCSRASPTETENRKKQPANPKKKRETEGGKEEGEKGEEIESASSTGEVKRMKEGSNEARRAYLFTNAGTEIRTSATGSETTTE